MTKGRKVAVVVALGASLLPVWRSGLREDMNFWQWVINHTIFGPPGEYIPEKYYLPEPIAEESGIYAEVR